ncbi:leucine-rich repeat domain-containing protein [Pseudomonas sp. 44 R 15]|uniref:leucine-rich repeat domain-containing protein n=1 Tax=Pseudomonas sp. 44 R 15 TaxID=1844105 RepID=UPI000811D70E|nr:DUF6543 domain-containing protein [Pseudomonas sp. 44 R 15]CRM30621.1 Leucine Rich repeats (2 copies) [Pseudomonas sp. 44 R 15]
MTNIDYSDTRLPDSHYQLLTGTLPPWLGNASASKRQALKAVQPLQLQGSAEQRAALARLTGAHWEAQNSVDLGLQSLQDIKAFATPILEQALKADFNLVLDVEATYLRLYIPDHIPWFSIRSGAARTWTVSLLDAALHNFEHKETLVDAYAPASTFITKPSASGQFDTLAQIKRVLSIPAFTSLCRDLDIGARYARYLNEALGMSNPVAAAVLRLKVDASQKAALRAALQLARINADISDDYADVIESLIAGTPDPRLDGARLRCQDLRMMGIALTGIQLFAPELESPRSPQRLVAYVPDDPQHPVKEYASPLAFKQELTRQLRDRDYQTFFSRFVPHAQLGVFFSGLSQHLARITWHPPVEGSGQAPWRSTPIDDPKLQFDAQPITGDPWLHLYHRKLDKILNDARTLAVSTASVDREARWRLWDSFVDVAASILNAALMVVAPFVPGLGELMLGYMAYQLLEDVFEGIVDWAEGLGKEAFGHLMSVLESLVQMGAFAVGGQIGPAELRKVLPEPVLAYIDSFKPVSLANGAQRYWKPDLAPYEYPSALPPRIGINELGLHEVRRESILPHEGKLYSVEKDADSEFYRIKHPSRPEAYRPVVRHNQAGAWHTELEQPLAWDRPTLLRRLGHSAQALSEADRELALDISGVPEDAVRKMHVNSERLSPLLDDTLSRLRIDRSLQRLIEQLRSDDPAVHHQIDPQDTLQLLTTHGPWPRTKALRIIDDKGQTAWAFGDRNVPVIQVHEAQLENGDLLKTVLRGLSPEEIRAQFDERASDPELSLENRSRLLRHSLADIAERQRSALFESRYAPLRASVAPLTQQLLSTTPELPASVAQTLVNQMTGAELALLHDGNTPPRLAELARTAWSEVRVNRAYEGQHLAAPPPLDTDRLELNSLRLLPGWSSEIRLDARHHSPTGPTWLQIGPTDAPIHRTLVRTEAGRYIPCDEQGELSSETDLYSAILSALPDQQRDQLDLRIHQGAELKRRLRQHSLPRDELRVLFTPDIEPQSVTETLRLLGSDNGYRAQAPAPLGPPSLLDRARALYPELREHPLTTLVNHLHSQTGGALAGLEALGIEYRQLERDLSTWQRNIPLQDPAHGSLLSLRQRQYEQRNRELIATELKRCWRRELPVDDYFEDPARDGYRLNLHYHIRGELPRLSANFDHVSMLTLSGSHHTQGAAGFLALFPRLRHLSVDSIPLGNVPLFVFQMRGLNVLSLSDCSVTLTPHSQTRLASLTQLQTLDLHKNPLGRVPSVEAMNELNTLDLSETGIDRLPPGMLTRNDLSAAFLSGNRISELPEALFDLPSHTSVAFDLSDNPLSSATLERVKAYYQQHGTYWEANAPAVDVRDAQQLYPSLDINQINQLIYSLPGDLEAGKRELARLAGELGTLQSELNHWAQQPQLAPPEATRRSQLNALLERSWRREIPQDTQFVHALEIPATLAGELPTLSARFKHVGSLTIKGNGGPMQSSALIDSFPALSILHLENVALGDMPAPVFNLPALTVLGLPRCSIALSPASAAKLQGMSRLEYLNLDHNPLVNTPDFSHLPRLSSISLKDTGLTQVPQSLLGDPPRQSINLSKNAIEQLPDALFSMPASSTSGLDLSENPLAPQALESIKRYCQRTGESFAAQAPVAQRRRTQQLYPSFLDTEADRFIFHLPGDLAAVDPTLTHLAAEYEQLGNDLQLWVQAVPDRHPILDVPIDEQTRAQDQLRRRNFKTLLEQAWRRESPEDEDSLDDELTHQVILDTPVMGDLPALNANFDHVTLLQLDGNGTTTGVDTMLRSFTHLQTLRLSKCSLGALPEALQRMPKLSTLDMTECAIRLTPETRGRLTALTELEFVNLSHNPLGLTPDISSLRELTSLHLSNAALNEVPQGVFGLDQLQTLDLSNNAIQEIPADLLETSAAFNGDSDLSGNPLSAQSLLRLRQYYQRTGVDFQVAAATVDNQGQPLIVARPVPDED